MLQRIPNLQGPQPLSPTSSEVMDGKASVTAKTQQLKALVNAIINETEKEIDTLTKSTGEQAKKECDPHTPKTVAQRVEEYENDQKSISYTEYKEVLELLKHSHHGWHCLNKIEIKRGRDKKSLNSLLDKLLQKLSATDPALSPLQKMKLVTSCYPQIGEKFETYKQNCNTALASLDKSNESDESDESAISFLFRMQKKHLLIYIYQSSKDLSLAQEAKRVLDKATLGVKRTTSTLAMQEWRQWASETFNLPIDDFDEAHFRLCKAACCRHDEKAIKISIKGLSTFVTETETETESDVDEYELVQTYSYKTINKDIANNKLPNPLVLAAAYNNIKMFTALLDNAFLELPFEVSKCDITLNSKLVIGDNIFHLIVRNRCMSLLTDSYLSTNEKLVSRNGVLDKPNKSGFTPCQLACHLGYVNIATKLLQLGANPNALTPNKNTVLHMLAVREYDELCKFVEHWKQSEHFKADDFDTVLNQQNKVGNTAIHIACMHGNAAIVFKLLTLGCNKEVKNKQGDTPSESAKKLRLPYTKNLILDLLTAEPSQLDDFESKVIEFTSASDYEQKQMEKTKATTAATQPTNLESKSTESIPATADEPDTKKIPEIKVSPPSPAPISKPAPIEATSEATELVRAKAVTTKAKRERVKALNVWSAHSPIPSGHKTSPAPAEKRLKRSHEVDLAAKKTHRINELWNAYAGLVDSNYYAQLKKLELELTTQFSNKTSDFIKEYMTTNKLSKTYNGAMTAKQVDKFLQELNDFLRSDNTVLDKFMNKFEKSTEDLITKYMKSIASNFLSVDDLISYEEEIKSIKSDYFSRVRSKINHTILHKIKETIYSLKWQEFEPNTSEPGSVTIPIKDWLLQEGLYKLTFT